MCVLQRFDDGLDKRDEAANHGVGRLGSLQPKSSLLASHVADSLPAAPKQLPFLLGSVDNEKSTNSEGLIPSVSLTTSCCESSAESNEVSSLQKKEVLLSLDCFRKG